MTIPDTLSDRVFEIPDFVSQKFCERYIAHACSGNMTPATITTQDGAAVHQEIRNNNRLVFDDDNLANTLWQDLSEWFSSPLHGTYASHLNPRFRLYEYSKGQYFDWHQDGSYVASDSCASKFTLMIYLNQNFEGGGTRFADVFYPRAFTDFTILPETRKALVFHHPISHRGDAVLCGAKYVLRTDVMFEATKRHSHSNCFSNCTRS